MKDLFDRKTVKRTTSFVGGFAIGYFLAEFFLSLLGLKRK